MSSSVKVHERIMSTTWSLVLPIDWMSGSWWMNSQQMKSASAAETSHSTYTDLISLGKPSTTPAAMERMSVDLPAPGVERVER